jgi:AcrR family transcriptional regulator
MTTALTPAFAATRAGDEPKRTRPTPGAAFARARAQFLAGERLDMGALAEELGIGRATLYRWTGDRQQLLGDIIWLELEAIIDHLRRTTPGSGVERIVAIAAATVDLLGGTPQLNAFLAQEGEAGLRLVTAPNGPVRPRLVAASAAVAQEEVDAGRYRPPADPLTLADGVIALAERFLHHGADPALRPDPATAHQLIALLLREDRPAPALG